MKSLKTMISSYVPTQIFTRFLLSLVILLALIFEFQCECVFTKCQTLQKGCPNGYTLEGYDKCLCKNAKTSLKKLICCRETSVTDSDVTDKIVGGEMAKPAQFPYQVSLRYIYSPGPDGHYCGGTIYNEHYVILAAHCNYEVREGVYVEIAAADLEVVAGDYRLLDSDPIEQRRPVEKIINHANYTPGKHHSDIALLKITRPFELSNTIGVNKIPLAPEMHTATGTGIISGWGSTNNGYGPYPNTLRYTSVSIITDEACRKAYSQNTIADYMICAHTLGKDSCQGDSGGPMVCEDIDGGKYLCGIVSFGRGCAEKDYPGVYTEISHFIPWIAQNTGVKCESLTTSLQ